MSTYTIELKRVIESQFGITTDESDYEIPYAPQSYDGIEYGRLPSLADWALIGLGTYPIFDEAYRSILNGKIVDNYFNREIGTETIDNWLLMIRRKMDQIMPYYNKLYLSEKIAFDPLSTYNLTTSQSSEQDNTSSSSAESDATSETDVASRVTSQELPQTMLAGNGDYASSAANTNSKTSVNGKNTQTGDTTGKTTGTATSTTAGFQGVASELLMRYRNSIINIDVMILNELEDCFMLVFDNGSAYAQNGWID